MPPALALASSVDPSALVGVWRADQMASAVGSVLSSGYPALDAQLPGGGWPVGALTELLQVQSGVGEWGLLLPALACSLSRATSPRATLVLVGAPHVPLGPALLARGLDAQRLLWVRTDTPAARAWACEQALRCADVTAVLAWLPQVRTDALRRLHLAAHDHAKLLWVLRPAAAQHESSPAPLRLLLATASPGLGAAHESLVSILKRRGPPLEQALPLALHSAALRALLAAAKLRGSEARETLVVRRAHALDRLAAAV